MCLSLFVHFSFGRDEDGFIYNGFLEPTSNLVEVQGSTQTFCCSLQTLQSKRLVMFSTMSSSFKTPSSRFVSNFSFSTTFVFAMVLELPNSGCHGLTFTISPSMDFSQAIPSQYFEQWPPHKPCLRN